MTKRSNNESFSITYKTKGRPYTKGLPFQDIKDAVLGKKYSLSLVFIEDKESKTLNKNYRKKNKPTNVLSFPLDKSTGEVFINMDSVRREHDNFHRTQKKFIAFLYIHALFHLKGLQHSSKMDAAEKKIRVRFLID